MNNSTITDRHRIEEHSGVHCCECGRLIRANEDVYECRTHADLCEDCLKMLHKKYWVR